MKNQKKQKLNNAKEWRSFEEVFGKSLKNKAYRKAYDEEIARLELAAQIKRLRLRNQLTQKNIAKRAGMPQSVVARIESGEHSFSLDTLSRLAQALGKRVQLV